MYPFCSALLIYNTTALSLRMQYIALLHCIRSGASGYGTLLTLCIRSAAIARVREWKRVRGCRWSTRSRITDVLRSVIRGASERSKSEKQAFVLVRMDME